MRLMRLAEVPASQRDRLFRYSPAQPLFVAFCVICASGGLVLIGLQQRSGLAYYVAGVLILGLVLMHKFILARFRPSNWLVRMRDEGLFVQFRSYLNDHFLEIAAVYIARKLYSYDLTHARAYVEGLRSGKAGADSPSRTTSRDGMS